MPRISNERLAAHNATMMTMHRAARMIGLSLIEGVSETSESIWEIHGSGLRCGNPACIADHGKGRIAIALDSGHISLMTTEGNGESSGVTMTPDEAETLRDDLSVAIAELRGS
jgi:hypothetical protein